MPPRGSFLRRRRHAGFQEDSVPRRRAGLLLVIAAFAAVLFLFNVLSGFLADWWWFKEIGYQVVFTRELVARTLLFLAAGGLTLGLLYGNLRLGQRGLVPNRMVFQCGESVPPFNVATAMRQFFLPVSLVAGLLAGLAVASAWSVVLQMIYQTPFGITDPVFSRDIGFYIFTLPGLAGLLGFLFGLVIISLLLLLPIYALRGDIFLSPWPVRFAPSAGVHLGILVAVLFLLTAVRLWFVDAPNLLYSTTGPLVGASYTDLYARLPAIRVTAVLALVAAAIVLIGAMRRDLSRWGLWAVGGYVAVALLGRGLFPLVIQKLVVAPTELTRETPYLKDHIAATRAAWGLDSVGIRELNGEADLTLADIRANSATIENVRLWDRDPLLQTFGQLQEIRTYYDFVSVDDDRYWIDGKVMVATIVRRLVVAVQFGSSNILFARDITNDSRVLYYRNIVERAGRALSLLRFDRDRYMVATTAGRFVWIADAYTTSDGYP